MSVEREGVATEGASNMVSPGQGRKGMPLSLVISPNLDALLEHEERKRQRQSSGTPLLTEPRTPDSSQGKEAAAATTMGPSVEIPKGLPPPPRRGKGPKSPITPIVLEPVAWGIQNAELVEENGGERPSSQSNPYINRAPTLEDVLQTSKERGRDGSRILVTAEKRTPPDRSRQSTLESWIDHEQAPLYPAHRPQILPLSLAPRKKAQTMPHTSIANAVVQDSRLGRTSPVVAPETPSNLWRRRPLISHAHNSSVSSSDSNNSSSTHPASTEENGPRISISSTIYQPSSDHSHQNHQIYNHRSSFDMARNSFMDLYSPANPAFTIPQISPAESNPEPLSPMNFSRSPVSEEDYAPYHSRQQPFHSFDTKPPLPTTPKPLFNRHVLKSRQASPKRSTPSPTTHEQKVQETRLPPTTNFLDVEERADLVRKSRKLARVFGQTPGADAMAQQDTGHFTSQAASKPRRQGVGAFNLATNPRRHSMPLTPDDVSFLSIASPTFDTYPASLKDEPQGDSADKSTDSYNRQATRQNKPSSRSSFIDLSDDEKEVAVPSGTSPGKPVLSSSPPSSLVETMSLDDPQDDERRRKRERLAKLHRFLGSRVPAHLVLGIDDLEASLPAESRSPSAYKSSSENEDGSRKVWLKRRRSSSTGVVPASWAGELDRVKEELDDKEKALNVRRAQKMEKVFGVAPPLTLYHTRHCPSPSSLPPTKSLPPLPPPEEAVTPTFINFSSNRAAYAKTKTGKNGRPGTSESSKQLLPKSPGSDQATLNDTRHSLIYTHYQHSLNSLNDILDRDDRESLAELHEYLNGAEVLTPKAADDKDHIVLPSPPPPSSRLERQASIASTIKSERRRSLPARTSMISLAGSEYTININTPKAEITTFQVRRRRAAKLTQFFGVNYRELVNDILDSIESGVDHEHMQGTLREEEFEDLRSKLRNLKTKRQGLF